MRILPITNNQVQNQNRNSNPNFNSKMIRVKTNTLEHIFLPDEILSGIHYAELFRGPIGIKDGLWVKCKNGLREVSLLLKIRPEKVNQAGELIMEAKSPTSSGVPVDLSECVEDVFKLDDITFKSDGLQFC